MLVYKIYSYTTNVYDIILLSYSKYNFKSVKCKLKENSFI